MGQQPSTAGKTRKKPKKGLPTAAEHASAASLYDDDDDEVRMSASTGAAAAPASKLQAPAASPNDSKRKLSRDAPPSPTKQTQPTAAVPASPKNAAGDAPRKPASPSAQPLASPSTAAAAAVAAAQPFVSDASNPFCGPLDHLREEERPFHHLASISHFDVPTLRKLHSIFTDISSSSTDDGIIDATELTEAMGLTGDCLLARAIFRIFDITQTQRINFRTWVTTLSALSPFASLDEKIRFSFSLYDVNSDGSIDINELRSLLAAAVRENVLDLSEAEVQSVCDHTLQHVDRDGNGMVEYEEYREVVMGSRKFMDSFTLDVSGLLESFRVKKGRETVTEEEARIRRTRFRGKDRAGAAVEGGAEARPARKTGGDAEGRGRGAAAAEEDGERDLERKTKEEAEAQGAAEAGDVGRDGRDGKTRGREDGKGLGHERNSNSINSEDPAAQAVHALQALL